MFFNLQIRSLFSLALLGLSYTGPWGGGNLYANESKTRYLIEFKSSKAGEEALSKSQAKVHLKLGDQKKIFAVTLRESKAAELKKNPNVLDIEKDHKRFPLSQTTPWGVNAIGTLAPELTGSGNAMVCIIDSGYAIHHQDLPQGVTTSPDAGTGNPLKMAADMGPT